MPRAFNDPLLLIGKIAAIFMQAAMAFGAIALVGVLVAIPFAQGAINAELRAELADPSVSLPLLPLIGVLLIGLAMVAMLFVFFDKLRRIIGTVGEGDPFVDQNAKRLSAMAWLMLGVQLLTIPAAAFGIYLLEFADQFEDTNVSVDAGMDMSGILLVILLFILARIFRHGTRLRDDLEGTV